MSISGVVRCNYPQNVENEKLEINSSSELEIDLLSLL